jgi:hypothetical protein
MQIIDPIAAIKKELCTSGVSDASDMPKRKLRTLHSCVVMTTPTWMRKND